MKTTKNEETEVVETTEAAEEKELCKTAGNVKKTARLGKYQEDSYKISAPLSDKDASDLTIIVNGKTYKIKRGEEVTVPRSVYEVYQNMLRMDALAIKRQRKLVEESTTK